MNGAVFHEEWFHPLSCDVLESLAKQVQCLSGAVVEVGSWEGRSTIVLANAVWPLNVRAVDTWQGSPGEISQQLAAERDVFAQFQRNIVAATRGNVWPYRMGWRDYFATYPDPVKLCFIDATHTYEEVRDNILAVLPLMVSGGVICGDDVMHPPVHQAVADTLDANDVNVEASLWFWMAP
jgi:predicted O-methyltransferase YrrM